MKRSGDWARLRKGAPWLKTIQPNSSAIGRNALVLIRRRCAGVIGFFGVGFSVVIAGVG